MDFKAVILLAAVIISAEAVKKSYSGYKVYDVAAKTAEEVVFLKDLPKNGGVEFWEEDFQPGHVVKVMVSPTKTAEIENLLKYQDIQYTLTIDDVQKLIDNQLKPKIHGARNEIGLDLENYHTYEEIYAWLDQLAVTYPENVRTIVMGQSVEGRDIKGVILNFRPEETENRLIGFIEGAIHAREWISPATINYLIYQFITSDDPGVRALADNFIWHIFPVVNPDGYSYTFTDNRMWRKNRSPAGFKSCESVGADDDMSNGVDLNRNFDFVWMSIGASDDSCSNTFAGPFPASEPEAQAIGNYVVNLQNQGRFMFYYAFHSYTQLLLVPFSHVSGDESNAALNYGDMFEVAARGAEVAESRHGTTYSVGLSAYLMYEMSGTSFDWVKAATNVPMSFLFELRDLGTYGFLLPAEQIIPTGMEILDTLVAMDQSAARLGYYQHTAAGSGSTSVVASMVTIVLSAVFMSVY